MAARGSCAAPPSPARDNGSQMGESGPGPIPESGGEVSGADLSPVSSGVNMFANDGSFLELFKQKMEKQRQEPLRHRPVATGDVDLKRKGVPAPKPSFVGKVKGTNKLVLKTGIIAKKQKTEHEEWAPTGDTWAEYMAEVNRYKARQCDDEDKTRPLVK